MSCYCICIMDGKHKMKLRILTSQKAVVLTERFLSVTSLIVNVIIIVTELLSTALCCIECHTFVTEIHSQTLLSCYQI